MYKYNAAFLTYEKILEVLRNMGLPNPEGATINGLPIKAIKETLNALKDLYLEMKKFHFSAKTVGPSLEQIIRWLCSPSPQNKQLLERLHNLNEREEADLNGLRSIVETPQIIIIDEELTLTEIQDQYAQYMGAIFLRKTSGERNIKEECSVAIVKPPLSTQDIDRIANNMPSQKERFLILYNNAINMLHPTQVTPIQQDLVANQKCYRLIARGSQYFLAFRHTEGHYQEALFPPDNPIVQYIEERNLQPGDTLCGATMINLVETFVNDNNGQPISKANNQNFTLIHLKSQGNCIESSILDIPDFDAFMNEKLIPKENRNPKGIFKLSEMAFDIEWEKKKIEEIVALHLQPLFKQIVFFNPETNELEEKNLSRQACSRLHRIPYITNTMLGETIINADVADTISAETPMPYKPTCFKSKMFEKNFLMHFHEQDHCWIAEGTDYKPQHLNYPFHGALYNYLFELCSLIRVLLENNHLVKTHSKPQLLKDLEDFLDLGFFRRRICNIYCRLYRDVSEYLTYDYEPTSTRNSLESNLRGINNILLRLQAKQTAPEILGYFSELQGILTHLKDQKVTSRQAQDSTPQTVSPHFYLLLFLGKLQLQRGNHTRSQVMQTH